jgi:hypothetical protein
VSFASTLQAAVELSFCVHGFPFVLRTNFGEARDSFARLYRQFLNPSGAEIGVEAVVCTESDRFRWRLQEKTGASLDLGSALWSLESALCEAILRSHERWIAIHAATVYSGDSAVMLIGPSGAGKSTVSVALSRRGFTLATDDVAFLDPETLDVHPIPRCVHLDRRSVELLEADGLKLPESWKRISFVAPVDLGSQPIPRCRAGLLIYIAAPRVERPSFKPVSQSEMAARLLSETGQGPLSDSQALSVLAKVSSEAGCFTLIPGSLSETADALSDLILRHRVAEFGRA